MLFLGRPGAPRSSCVGDISSHSWAAVGEAFPWVSWCSASRRWWPGRSPGSQTFCHRWCPQGARRFASRSRYPWRWFQKTQTLEETQKQLRHFWRSADSVMFFDCGGGDEGRCGLGWDGHTVRSATHWHEYRVVKRDWRSPSCLSLLFYWCCQHGRGDFMKGTQELMTVSLKNSGVSLRT